MRKFGRFDKLGRCFAVSALLAFVAGGHGTPFTWNFGATPNTSWIECDNWKYAGMPVTCYPSQSNDDVTIPTITSGAWTIGLVNQTIRDMTISGNTGFVPVAGTPCVQVKTLTISAQGQTVPVVVTFQGAEMGIGTFCTTQ